MVQRHLHIVLEPLHRQDAEAGKINIFNLIASAFRGAGWDVGYRDLVPGQPIVPPLGDHALFFMQEPLSDRALTLRRAYHYPFWRIEATNERWRTDVARATFDPDAVDPALATPFARRWARTLLGGREPRQEGYVFIPLQGRLRDHRSFQSMSPLAMIEATLQAEPQRRLVLKLHPKEAYTPTDMAALERITRHPRVDLVDADALDLLAGCDYVVTQNSGLAFTGFFLRKPAVTFAAIDFHHIAAPVADLGVADAFQAVLGPPPAFDRYIHWFLQENAINGGRDDAQARILARAARFGWPVQEDVARQ